MKALLDVWAERYGPTPANPLKGVLTVSFAYDRGFGARIEAGEVRLCISGGVESPAFESRVTWPLDNYESQIVDGIVDAMYQHAQAPVGLHITLKEIGWHDVNSCGNGFYFAAREATLSALRILSVPRERGAQPGAPSDVLDSASLRPGLA